MCKSKFALLLKTIFIKNIIFNNITYIINLNSKLSPGISAIRLVRRRLKRPTLFFTLAINFANDFKFTFSIGQFQYHQFAAKDIDKCIPGSAAAVSQSRPFVAISLRIASTGRRRTRRNVIGSRKQPDDRANSLRPRR